MSSETPPNHVEEAMPGDEVLDADEMDALAPPLDPQTATADELVDEETRESYRNILATQKFIETSQEDQRILLLQQAEIVDLLERTDELGKNEYFDVKYVTSECRKVWQARELDDRNTTNAARPNAVRLFPNAEAVLHQQQLFEKLKEDHALEDRDELKRRHPLLFNRVVRDESRRSVFNAAMEARRQFDLQMATTSTLPLLLQAQQHQQQSSGAANTTTTQSCSASVLHATKAPLNKGKAFAHLPEYIRRDVQYAVAGCHDATAVDKSTMPPEQEAWAVDVAASLAAAGQIVDAAGTYVSAAEPAVEQKKPPTLVEMLAQQRQQLRELEHSEEVTYRPLLASYFAYDEMVRKKFDKLASDLGIHDSDAVAAAST